MRKTAGIVLIVVGLVVLIWGSFGFKTREKVLDIGSLHAARERKHYVPNAPIAGALIIAAGAILIAAGRRG